MDWLFYYVWIGLIIACIFTFVLELSPTAQKHITTKKEHAWIIVVKLMLFWLPMVIIAVLQVHLSNNSDD